MRETKTIDLGVLREDVVERMGGQEPEEWAGQCHAVASVVAGLLGPENATVRRGYFIGEPQPGAYFYGRFSQHSWVELRDGQVCDPTRFAFVGGDAWPLWVGPDDEYDVGGRRSAPAADSPPSCFASERDPVELNLGSVQYVAGLLGTPSWDWDWDDDAQEGWIMVSPEQAAWLANLPIKSGECPGVLARHFAAEVYEALINAGLSGLIPIDRRDWILPERSNGRSSF